MIFLILCSSILNINFIKKNHFKMVGNLTQGKIQLRIDLENVET